MLTSLIGVLYFGLSHFGLTGMIASAVAAILLEKVIAETMVIRKLGLGVQHLKLLKVVGKTAIISVVAGLATYFVYQSFNTELETAGHGLAQRIFATDNQSILDLVGGSVVLLTSAAVFAPIYLIAASLWGVLEEEDKRSVTSFLQKFRLRRPPEPMQETHI